MKKRGHNDYNSPGDAIKPLLAKTPTQNIRVWIENNNVQKIAISLACASLGSVFYFWSLIGGTDRFLMAHAKEIIAYFLLALISYELSFVYIFKIDGWKGKLCVSAIVVTLLYYTLQYDQGASFDHHGEYNIVAFACLFTLTSTIIASIYIIRRYRKLREFGILLVLIFIYINFKSISVKQNYPKGLFNDRLNNDIDGICKMPEITPWVDFLPRRFFNFFTGSERCEFTHKPFSFIEGSVLTIDCDEDAFYTINANFTARDKFMEYHEGEPIETSNLKRLWDQLESQNVRRKYTGPVRISEGEYILCECGKYTDYHMQNVHRDEIELEAQKKRPESAKYNVMVVLFDSTSRAHFKRRLPRSARVIEKLDVRNNGEFEVFQFHRYHALSFATPGNLRPLIAGMKSEELRSMKPKASDYFMWKPYKENGYVNMYIHDLCQDNFKNYFYDNTSNVYMDYDVVLPFCHYEYADSSGMYSNFRGGPYSIERRCINERYVHSYTFDYMTEFMENYRESPKFVFTHMIEAHESSGSVISTVDQDFALFVEHTMSSHPNTLLIITADHGLKVGPYSLSPQGKVENQNPVLYTIFPKSFMQEHEELRENLKHNEQALATHFDLHRTILQFREYPKLEEPDYSNYTYSRAARTLFEKIPYTRTCEEAGMSDDKPCMCTGRIL